MKKKSLLISSIAMLMISVIGLTVGTYAWFVTTRTPAVGEIDFEAATTSGLKVNITDQGVFGDPTSVYNWRDVVSSADLKAPASGTYANSKTNWYSPMDDAVLLLEGTAFLDAATPKTTLVTADKLHADAVALDKTPTKTYGAATNKNPAMAFYGADVWLDSDPFDPLETYVGDVDYENGDVVTQKHIEFMLFFRAESNMAVNLDISNTVIVPKVTTTTEQEDLLSSLRIAFIPVVDYNTQAAATAVVGDAIVYEPYDDLSGYNTLGEDYNGIYEEATYATQKQSVITAASTSVDNIVRLPLFDIAASTAVSGVLQNDHIVGLKVYIWIEGNDFDCNSLTAGGTAGISFQFIGDLI